MEADSDEERNIEQEHPLTNLAVLQELFKYEMSPAVILRNRLVNINWLLASAGPWLKLRKRPVLHYNEVVREEGQGTSGGPQFDKMSLPEFYKLYQNKYPMVTQMLATSPHKMELHAWQFVEESTGVSPDLDLWFWKWTATETLTELTLVDCEFQREAWVFKERFLKLLPSLKNLTVRDCMVHSEAFRDINQAHQAWMEHGGRPAWKQLQRRVVDIRELEPNELAGYPEDVQRGHRFRNVPYYLFGYQHQHLLSLDVSLKVAVGGDEALKSTTPLRIWGPLLAMTANLKRLRIGGYQEDTEEPPPTLREPGWDNDIHPAFGMILAGAVNRATREYWEKLRRTWIGGHDYMMDVGPDDPSPLHLGNFWELIWDEAIGQVSVSLECLDLLDFSGNAQHYGVLSTYEAAYENKDIFGEARVYAFFQMKDISLDLGLDPVFAMRDLRVLPRWIRSDFNRSAREYFARRLTLYRAPFADPDLSIKLCWRQWYIQQLQQVEELELWGNLSPGLEFLFRTPRIQKFRWTTSCYEEKYHGKRVVHLMREGRKAFPLFREDLVKKTDWSDMSTEWWLSYLDQGTEGLPNLRHLEMDWGPISLDSFRQLGLVAPNLTNLKSWDEQLAEITKLWPELESLEMAHGSRVTAKGLEQHLPNLRKLANFKWTECACTRQFFQVQENEQLLREVVEQLEKSLAPEAKVVIPWDLSNKRTENGVCIQAEFEHALLSGEYENFLTKFADLY